MGAAANADAYHAQPKLVVVLVLDQFRGDYLERYRDDFKARNGFNLFLERGAYFTDCYFDYANTMTGPGHATIGTGAYTDGHGIASNDWWNFGVSTAHTVSSVDDARYRLVGVPAGGVTEPGASPHNELASTLGDEVVLATGGESRVFGISLKDRAAILLSGHAARGAYWVDRTSGAFITSSYYMQALPDWVIRFNASGRTQAALTEAGVAPGKFYDLVGRTSASINYQLDFAKALIAGEKLGSHGATDVLTISISATDILGHEVGPDAAEQRKMIDTVDVDLDVFFSWLDKHVEGGLGNVWIALTADHGVAPTMEQGRKVGMPSANVELPRVIDVLNDRLTERFSAKHPAKYVMVGGNLPYLALDSRVFEKAGVKEADAEQAVAELLPDVVRDSQKGLAGADAELPMVRRVYTRTQMAKGDVPATEEGRMVLHSYSPNDGWYVFVTFGMYEFGGHVTGTTHFSPYAYDRHVPLAFFGSAFEPGVYRDAVAPVDIVSTFASLLGVNRPSASVGRVLTMALKKPVTARAKSAVKR